MQIVRVQIERVKIERVQIERVQIGLVKIRKVMLGIVLAGLAALLAPSASAQSCALCYTQAASSGARMIQALKSGILILIAPPTLGSIGVIVVMYRKRNQVRMDGSGDENGEDW